MKVNILCGVAPNTDGDVEKAVLAMAAAGRRVDKVDMIWLAGGKSKNMSR